MKKHLIRALAAGLVIPSLLLAAVACHTENPEETTAAQPTETTATADTLPPPADTETDAEETTEAITEAETEPAETLPSSVSLPEGFTAADVEYICDDGSILYTFNGKTESDYNTACAYYQSQGFLTYSSVRQGANPATTFTGVSVMAHVYWIQHLNELNIVLSETAADTLPPVTPAVTDGDYVTSVTQLQDTGTIGMGYVIQLADGSYIIYDGSGTRQASKIIRFLTDNHKGEGKPIVRAWVLTHSHNDHYPAFELISDKDYHRKAIILEHIIVSPLNDEKFTLNSDEEFYLSTKFYEDAAKFDGAKIVFAHTGMEFSFCNIKMEILLTPENLYKTATDVGNFNDTSIISRLYNDEYAAIFTGDVSGAGLNFTVAAYGTYLKSDICQVSHHGVEGEYIIPFHDLVAPPILFYPCSYDLYMTGANRPTREIMETKDYVKEIMIHGLGRYTRAWGTTFDADAPLTIFDTPQGQ